MKAHILKVKGQRSTIIKPLIITTQGVVHNHHELVNSLSTHNSNKSKIFSDTCEIPLQKWNIQIIAFLKVKTDSNPIRKWHLIYEMWFIASKERYIECASQR